MAVLMLLVTSSVRGINMADDMKNSVDIIANESFVYPAGYAKVADIRHIWSDAYPELELFWKQKAPETWIPIYRHDELVKVLSVWNKTDDKPELNVPQTSSLSRDKKRDRACIISLIDGKITVENFPLLEWNYEKAKKVFSAPAADYNFIPVNATS